MSSEAFPAKTQAMSLPYPGLAASKLASKLQSSTPKRASELCEAGFLRWRGCRGHRRGLK
jgi:hypothetical protein